MAQNPRILSTAAIPPVALEAFASLGQITVMDSDQLDGLRDVDVLIVRGEQVDDEFLADGDRLRVIARTGVGLDSIDMEAVSRRGIPLVYVPDAGTLAVAEGTLTLIIACLKRLGELGAVVAEGRWAERYQYDILDIAGTTLGIVGLGRIGRQVALLAQAIGMDVVAYDPRQQAHARAPVTVTPKSLEALFAEADVITLHCPLTDETRNLVDARLLATTKTGAVLINASRGGLVAGDDLLLEALHSGRLSGVGLDVFVDEPPTPDCALLRDPRVLSTPHSIGLTRSWNRQVFGSLARDVSLVLAGELPRNIANPEVLTDRYPIA